MAWLWNWGGFALVFNTKKLEEMLEIEAKRFSYSVMHLSDLIYSNDENKLKEKLSEDLSIIADVIKLFFNHKKLVRKEDMEMIGRAYHPFVHCISRYKHYGFCEENEVRVVALPTVFDQEYLKLAEKKGAISQPEKERKFRKKEGEYIPYIEFFNSIDIELPIEKIIVGPHKEKETRAVALSSMLRNTNIEITCSNIPFVG